MNHKTMRIDSLKKTILGQINRVEDATGQMFHRAYPETNQLFETAMDSSNPAQLNHVIKILDDLLSEV